MCEAGWQLPDQILAWIDTSALTDIDADNGLAIFKLARKSIGTDDIADAVLGVEGEFTHRAFTDLCWKTDELAHDAVLC